LCGGGTTDQVHIKLLEPPAELLLDFLAGGGTLSF